MLRSTSRRPSPSRFLLPESKPYRARGLGPVLLLPTPTALWVQGWDPCCRPLLKSAHSGCEAHFPHQAGTSVGHSFIYFNSHFWKEWKF